jgi:hypothetical protein
MLLLGRLSGTRAKGSKATDSVFLPQSWFRELILDDNSELSKILPEIARRHTFRGPIVPLSAQAMQRVLAFCRRSEDPRALSGGLVCLVGSRFWGLADPNLLLKMIEADAQHADVASRLFDTRWIGDRDPVKLLDLANSVLKGKVPTSRNTSVAAAAFCAQNISINFEPLTSLFRFAV